MGSIIGVAQAAFGVLDKTVQNTPVVGSMHRWTTQRASSSHSALGVLGALILSCAGLMMYILHWVFKLIILGKLNSVAASVIIPSFTLLGGVLAVTVPAFVSAINASSPPPVLPEGPK